MKVFAGLENLRAISHFGPELYLRVIPATLAPGERGAMKSMGYLFKAFPGEDPWRGFPIAIVRSASSFSENTAEAAWKSAV